RPTEVRTAVDRARAVDHLAARQRKPAVVRVRLRPRRQPPAELRAHDRGADRRRDPNVGMLLRAARLDQADSMPRILGKPRGQHAAGRARADDDVVEIPIGSYRAQEAAQLVVVALASAARATSAPAFVPRPQYNQRRARSARGAQSAADTAMSDSR